MIHTEKQKYLACLLSAPVTFMVIIILSNYTFS